MGECCVCGGVEVGGGINPHRVLGLVAMPLTLLQVRGGGEGGGECCVCGGGSAHTRCWGW